MKKRVMMFVLLSLLVLSLMTLAIAQPVNEGDADSSNKDSECSGFWGWLKCLFTNQEPLVGYAAKIPGSVSKLPLCAVAQEDSYCRSGSTLVHYKGPAGQTWKISGINKDGSPILAGPEDEPLSTVKYNSLAGEVNTNDVPESEGVFAQEPKIDQAYAKIEESEKLKIDDPKVDALLKEALELAQESGEDDHVFYAQLAESYEGKGDYVAAASYWEEAMDLTSDPILKGSYATSSVLAQEKFGAGAVADSGQVSEEVVVDTTTQENLQNVVPLPSNLQFCNQVEIGYCTESGVVKHKPAEGLKFSVSGVNQDGSPIYATQGSGVMTAGEYALSAEALNDGKFVSQKPSVVTTSSGEVIDLEPEVTLSGALTQSEVAAQKELAAGIGALAQNNFQTALDKLHKAKALDPNNKEIKQKLVEAYAELCAGKLIGASCEYAQDFYGQLDGEEEQKELEDLMKYVSDVQEEIESGALESASDSPPEVDIAVLGGEVVINGWVKSGTGYKCVNDAGCYDEDGDLIGDQEKKFSVLGVGLDPESVQAPPASGVGVLVSEEIPPALQKADPFKALDAYKEGKGLLEQGDFEDAIQKFGEAEAFHEGNPEYIANLGLAYAGLCEETGNPNYCTAAIEHLSNADKSGVEGVDVEDVIEEIENVKNALESGEDIVQLFSFDAEELVVDLPEFSGDEGSVFEVIEQLKELQAETEKVLAGAKASKDTKLTKEAEQALELFEEATAKILAGDTQGAQDALDKVDVQILDDPAYQAKLSAAQKSTSDVKVQILDDPEYVAKVQAENTYDEGLYYYNVCLGQGNAQACQRAADLLIEAADIHSDLDSQGTDDLLLTIQEKLIEIDNNEFEPLDINVKLLDPEAQNAIDAAQKAAEAGDLQAAADSLELASTYAKDDELTFQLGYLYHDKCLQTGAQQDCERALEEFGSLSDEFIDENPKAGELYGAVDTALGQIQAGEFTPQDPEREINELVAVLEKLKSGEGEEKKSLPPFSDQSPFDDAPGSSTKLKTTTSQFIQNLPVLSDYTADNVVEEKDGIIFMDDGSAFIYNPGDQLDPEKVAYVPNGDLVANYRSMIEWNEPVGEGGEINLKNGGSLTIQETYSGIIVTEVVMFDQKGDLNQVLSGQTFTLPDGTSYSQKEWKLEGDRLVSKQNNDYTIQYDKESNQIITNKDEIETTLTLNAAGDVIATQLKEFDGNELESVSIQFADGLVFESEEIDDDKIFEGRYYQNGELVGICFDCSGQPSLNNNIFWVEEDAACAGTYEFCYSEGEPNEGNWNAEDAYIERCEDFGDKNSCAIADAINTKEWDGFWSGETTTQKTISAILGVTPGAQGLNAWLFPEVTRKWQKEAAEKFDKAMAINLVGDYVLPDGICSLDQSGQVKTPGSSAAWIQGPGESTQGVGSIQAEKTPQASPALCSEEVTCSEGSCKDGVCMLNDNVVQATFYKISWGVTAPVDIKSTPYLDENGVAVEFNVQLKDTQGNTKPYLYNGGAGALKLENGQPQGHTYVTYSARQYDEACILFTKPMRDIDGDEVKEICADFVLSEQGEVNWKSSGKKGSSSTSSGSGIVTVEDVGVSQI